MMVYRPARQNSTNRDPVGIDVAVRQDKELVPIIGSLFSLSTNGINSIFECRGFFIVLIGDVCKIFQIFSKMRDGSLSKTMYVSLFFPSQSKINSGFCSKFNCIPMKLLYFVKWHSARASKSAKIVLSKSILDVKN